MAHTKRAGTEITDFWPDDTATTIYLESSIGYTLEDILEKAKEKWAKADMTNISISSEKIHTHCIYYDLYDPSDYTDFIIITYTGE